MTGKAITSSAVTATFYPCPNCGQIHESTACPPVQLQLPLWNYGWICPRCGAGLSPSAVRCPCGPPLYPYAQTWS